MAKEIKIVLAVEENTALFRLEETLYEFVFMSTMFDPRYKDDDELSVEIATNCEEVVKWWSISAAADIATCEFASQTEIIELIRNDAVDELLLAPPSNEIVRYRVKGQTVTQLLPAPNKEGTYDFDNQSFMMQAESEVMATDAEGHRLHDQTRIELIAPPEHGMTLTTLARITRDNDESQFDTDQERKAFEGLRKTFASGGRLNYENHAYVRSIYGSGPKSSDVKMQDISDVH